MRLKKLKLSGFKSFVEPTTVDFPSELVGVLGPNGCGKSNIIDAVRWVMGESSAKNLRGESMTDVIFNGSRDRKPVGQASVELIFENSQGRLLGEYAAYSEIAVRRVVTREAISTYYINNTKCRRKDVTDIFLGTGLGPRSYSIIGQGTISRVIEAKPEEMRVFLEEAAGISKYKEKRRETQNRIRHTEDNIERVNDIREELGKQLERLNRQARAAEKFKLLKQEERTFKSQWHVLRWQGFSQEIEALDKMLSENRLRVEEQQARLSGLETNIEAKRQAFETSNEGVTEAQAKYYQIGAEIARLEETLSNQKERRDQLELDLMGAKEEWDKANQHYKDFSEKQSELTAEVERLRPIVYELEAISEETQENLITSEKAKEEWQKEWEQFNALAAESSKMAHVEQTRIQQLEDRLQNVQIRLEKLSDEMQSLEITSIENEIEEALKEQAQEEALHQENALTIETIDEQKELLTTECQDLESHTFELREQLQELKAKKSSLVALQEAALGKQEFETMAWLEAQGLDKVKRLVEHIDIDDGWERAFEAVLGDRLQALCVDDFNAFSDELKDFNNGTLTFVCKDEPLNVRVLTEHAPLYKKLQSDLPVVQNLLSGIYAASDFNEALEIAKSMGANESVVTQEGLWLGKGWLRAVRPTDESRGIIEREKAIKVCQEQLEKDEDNLTTELAKLESLKEELKLMEERKAEAQALLNHSVETLSEIKSTINVKQNRLKQNKARLEVVEVEHANELSNNEDCEEKLLEARTAWQTAMESMESDSQNREKLTEQRELVNQQLDEARIAASSHRQRLHENQLSLNTKQSELDAISLSLTREQSLCDTLKSRIDSLVKAQEEMFNVGDLPKVQLEEKLKAHVVAEEVMTQAKVEMEQVKEALHQLESERNEVMEDVRREEGKRDEIRMDKQALSVRRQTIEETLAEEETDIKVVQETLPEEATEAEWDKRIKELELKIQRLGPINLAAIDEYEIESERKVYLDKQHDDLVEALELLASAIRKIDKETRMRFKDTFDLVNDHFQHLFPKVFGGGQAYLELTGEDLLDTGVTVMARPPGKRNTTIHLLSGGEKALTAVALVFAIFQLNPSPFCMLDEVDAPLDDSNVGRFCNLVKEMSEFVQFIFITHNKVTMELADQLMGVTMHEPGVSRIVSVDVDEAISLAG